MISDNKSMPGIVLVGLIVFIVFFSNTNAQAEQNWTYREDIPSFHIHTTGEVWGTRWDAGCQCYVNDWIAHDNEQDIPGNVYGPWSFKVNDTDGRLYSQEEFICPVTEQPATNTIDGTYNEDQFDFTLVQNCGDDNCVTDEITLQPWTINASGILNGTKIEGTTEGSYTVYYPYKGLPCNDPPIRNETQVVSWNGTFSVDLEQPAPVLSVATTGTNVSVSWTSVPGAAGYRLFYAPFPFTGLETIGSIDMKTQTSLSADLWSGAAYYVAVQAYDQTGSSDYSNIEDFVIGEFPDPNDLDDDEDGYTENQGDCNDSAESIYSGATEICGDGIDQNCNGRDRACSQLLTVPFERNRGSTCVASSFTMVVRYYYPALTFNDVFNIFGLPPFSAEPWRNFENRVENDLNLEMEYYDNCNIDDVIEVIDSGYPVVVQQYFSHSDRTGHDRVVIGYDFSSRVLILNDPSHLGANYTMTFDLFDDLWNFNDYGSTRNLYLLIPEGSPNPLHYLTPYRWY